MPAPSTADLPVLRNTRTGQLLCGSKATTLGKCVQCGYRPPRFDSVRHGGTCPKCGGLMRCHQNAMHNGRCKNHGGKSPRGISASRWDGGRRSKYLPGPIGDIYGESLKDKTLLSLRDEIALVDARMSDLCSSLQESDREGSRWSDLVGILDEMERHRSKNDPDAVASTLERLSSAIRAGSSTERIWGQLQGFIEARRRLAETEVKHLLAHRQMLSVEHAMALIHRIADIIKRNVHDRATLNSIAIELGKLVTAQAADPDLTAPGATTGT